MRRVQRIPTVIRAIALVSLLGAAPLVAASCGGSYAATICTNACDCSKCGESQFDECVQTLTDSEKVADDVGCADQASEYEACIVERADCILGFYVTGECDSVKGSLDACLAKSGCELGSDNKIHC